MKTDKVKKVVIKVATSQEQQENLRNQRRTLKTLECDKENIITRAFHQKDANAGTNAEKHDAKRKDLADKAVQAGEATITADDLTSDEPGLDYWKRLAEKRGDALNDSLQENEQLKEQIDNLEAENRICKEMLEESKTLVEVLQEMLGEADTSTEMGQEALEHQ